MRSGKIAQANFFHSYKIIRNKFRKYDPVSLLELCFSFLNKKYDDPIEEISTKQPWQILLLIKWILIDDEFYTIRRKRATRNDLIQLINLIRELGNKDIIPKEHIHHLILLRVFPFQQFMYQTSFNIHAFARQSILFSDLPDNHFISSTFFNKNKIRIDTFITFSIFLLAHQLNNNQSITKNYFSALLKHFSQSDISNYLKCLSLTIPEARRFVKEINSGNKISLHEYYEQTPFIAKPLLQVYDKYYSYYPNILFRGLEYFIYDSIREIDSSKFMNKFGKIFENYISKILDYIGIDYIREDEIKSELLSRSKVVDFLIREKNSTILIDAKGVEMSYLGKVSHQAHIIRGAIKNSVIKAIEQGYETIFSLKSKSSKLISESNNDNYLIILTYKELNIGNGVVFKEAIAPDFFEKLLEKYSGEELIPADNIFFITINSFEIWAELIKMQKSSVCNGLEIAKTNDRDFSTSKFNFTTHVYSWTEKDHLPQFLIEEFDKLHNKAVNLVTQN